MITRLLHRDLSRLILAEQLGGRVGVAFGGVF